jgi:ATP-dependent DNA helicase RecG
MVNLKKLGIETTRDLLNFTPKNYIDLEAISDLKKSENGSFVTLELFITYVSKPFKKGKLEIFSAFANTNDDIKVKLVWFNSNYVSKIIAVNKRMRCFGKIKIQNECYELVNPVYEIISGSFSTFRGIRPIYPVRGILPQSTIVAIIKDALTDFEAFSIISKDVEETYAIGDLTQAYQMIHKPEFMSDIKPARERIFIEETVRRICAYNIAQENKRTINYNASKNIIEPVIQALPYKLTQSQENAKEKIIGVLKSKELLNAMLAGDVGSGKTIVAILAAYFAVKSDRQVAVLVPTEILALQHIESFNKILSPFNVRCALLIGSLTVQKKNKLKNEINNREVDIVIGTHAVFSKGVDFKDLGLVIIDEQHRFGVAQRTALIKKSENADVLTLSATPIPRSLRLAILGDVDLINIDRRHDPTNVITAIVPPEKKQAMIDYIIQECRNGKQAYIVAPRIYDDEGIEGDSAEKLYKELVLLSKDIVSVAMIHGKCTSSEKSKCLEEFSSNKVSILVSTSIVEVGIDVPNASLLIIFDAEQFGLATLHQLRGRIGRDGQKSYCFLYSRKFEEEDIIRLKVLVSERDGLRIAERDYETRGAGDWLGENQSGKSDFNPSLKIVNIAKAISKLIDVKKYEKLLEQYREKYTFKKISLS